MRNHKTGCGRCSRKVCCCPRPVTSCLCPPGPAGPPGPPGSAGAGADGAGLAPFSNVLGLVLGYMNNSGGGGLSATPRNYPIGQETLYQALAVHLSGVDVPAAGETITVALTQNGAPTDLTVTFDSTNLTATERTLIATGAVLFAPGDLFDIQVTDADLAVPGATISATIS